MKCFNLFVKMFLLDIIILVCSILFFSLHCELAQDIINDEYMGEKFPVKYLEPENFTSNFNLIELYINALTKTIGYYYYNINFTDINKGIGTFLSNAILKRTLLEDGFRLTDNQRKRLRYIISQTESIVSHLVYDEKHVKKEFDNSFRVSQLFKEAEQMVYFIKPFNRGKLKKWIGSKGKINDFLEEMDAATLPKEKYVELVDDSIFTYFIKIEDSDICLSRIIYNIQPSPKVTELRPCRKDSYCKTAIHASPSISYGLSHRLVNMLMYQGLRRCYWVSPKADELHIDILCAYMYRETLFLARRGYFGRDIFLEHIALCGMMGYEQFFRQHWFRKVVSWMNDDGCIQENPNFSINRTARYIRTGNFNVKEVAVLRKNLKKLLLDECHNHPMALLTVVLSHAIRYAAHLLPS